MEGTSEGTDSILEEKPTRKKAQARRQLAVRLPIKTFEDLQTLRIMRGMEGANWSMNETMCELAGEYVERYRDEIDEFRARVNSPKRSD